MERGCSAAVGGRRTMIVVLVLCCCVANVVGDVREDFRRYKRSAADRAIRERCQPQIDYVRHNFDRSDYMYSQKERLASKRLIDLNLIGSHNAATYGIWEAFDEYSVCQNAPLRTQLAAGVRYLDVRAGAYDDENAEDGSLLTGHGPHSGPKLRTVLEEIAEFSREHPREFLIVSLKDAGWSEFGPRHKRRMLNTVLETFGNTSRITDEDAGDWFRLENVTLGDVWARNRSMLILYQDKLLRAVGKDRTTTAAIKTTAGTNETSTTINNIDAEDLTDQGPAMGLMPREQLIDDPWANTHDPIVLFRKLDDFYRNHSRNFPNRFFIAQCILTSAVLITDGVDRLTAELQRSERIPRWLQEHPDYNVVYLDFVLGVGETERSKAIGLLEKIMGGGVEEGGK